LQVFFNFIEIINEAVFFKAPLPSLRVYMPNDILFPFFVAG